MHRYETSFFISLSKYKALLYPCNLVDYARLTFYALAVFYFETPFNAALSFSLGHFLDIFDGPLARHFQHTTKLGDYFDHFLDYISIPLSFCLLPHYSALFKGLCIVYCLFTLTEMVVFGRHYKFFSEGRPLTRRLIQNNYANPLAFIFTYFLMVEPMILWGLEWGTKPLYVSSVSVVGQFYLGFWFVARLVEGWPPFWRAVRS